MGTFPLCLILAVMASVTHAAIKTDLVSDLPGLSWQPKFKHYSGYLKATGTRHLHYWFVESSHNPKADPVVLWLNGGPGCSSLDGLLTENGPFQIADDGRTIRNNPYSWNKVANMLYLEAPAGVGYSYSDDKNYTTGDDQVSLDNLAALKYFMAHYPEYAKNEFFITGESYGGIYVPTLSVRVVDDGSFNFKGFAVGNGLSNDVMNANSIIPFGYYHGLYGVELWGRLLKGCCKDGRAEGCDFSAGRDPACISAVNEIQGIVMGLNIYNLLDECHTAGQLQGAEDAATTVISPMAFLFPPGHPNTRTLQRARAGNASPLDVKLLPPCINVTSSTNYLNQAVVRKALHVPESLPKWEICSGTVGMEYRREYSDMAKQYHKVLDSKKYHILVYNGDVDMACNFLGDEWFVDSLQLKSKAKWGPWFYKSTQDQSQQVAGFIKQYENLSFVTIKGAGHMVPTNKPNPAFVMFNDFLNGKI